MKKFFVAALIVGMCVAPTAVYAQADSIGEGMANRAVRGFTNMLTAIIELPMQVKKGYDKGFGYIENEAGSKTVGTVLGFFRGLGHAGGRFASGSVELLGFWAASPIDNEGVGVPLDAEYAWEEGEQYNIFEPSLAEGVKPMGRKLVRGLSNGLLGIAELPGQIKKGADEGNVAKGAVKGVWYWFSRGVYGLGDIYAAFAPNTVDNLGVHFDEENPWDALVE